jgi:pantoate--beta-alanine ligase
MIVRLPTPDEARRWCAETRRSGQSLGFVPTMGALHEGHLELVRTALRENRAVCVSVFVNPLQFNDPRDFERYPRDLDADAKLLDDVGCTMVFTGTLATFFPRDLRADGTFDPSALRDPGPSAEGLEGAHRPGHFAGVATIVARLFDVVRPDRAYFGRKDYQQTLVVRDLASALEGPTIVVCPTSREPSGLARSSRNELLAAQDRERARSRRPRSTRDF